MKKIVIIGGLGYLGTELCKIYSGESWSNKIIAIDSRFISERVNQLKEWNIEFFQGHILDLDFLKKHLKRFISTSDIIINILPKTLETKNFVNRNFLNSMKKKSLLINIGRGDTIDENALIMHSRKNENFMAILDVFKNEPLKKNHCKCVNARWEGYLPYLVGVSRVWFT